MPRISPLEISREVPFVSPAKLEQTELELDRLPQNFPGCIHRLALRPAQSAGDAATIKKEPSSLTSWTSMGNVLLVNESAMIDGSLCVLSGHPPWPW
jgi:hypothetical protein